MNKIKIHIDNIPKFTKTPILDYCRQLIDEGVSPQMSLEVWGPHIKDFKLQPGERWEKDEYILYMRVNVGNGAKLTVNEESTPRFVKYVPPQRLRMAKSTDASDADALFIAKGR
jgi:hypothetical protein